MPLPLGEILSVSEKKGESREQVSVRERAIRLRLNYVHPSS